MRRLMPGLYPSPLARYGWNILFSLLLFPTTSHAASSGPPVLEEWQTLPPLKYAADGVAAAAIGPQLYVFGGSTNSSHNSNNGIKAAAVLNTATKTWNPLPSLSSGRCCAAAQVYHDEIFIIGGMQNEDVFGEVEVFNTTGNYWHTAHPLLTSRCCMAVVLYGGDIWVLGGGDSRGYALDSIEIYSPRNKKWKESSIKLSEPRTFFGAAAYEESIIVAGGQVNYDPRTCVQKFYPGNPGKGWTNLAPPTYAHRAFASVIWNEFFFVLGGMGKDTGLEPIAKVEVYNMKHDEWNSLIDLPGARDCAAAVITNDHLLAIGGFGPTDRQGKVLGDVLSGRLQLPHGGSKGSHSTSHSSSHFAMWILLLMLIGAAIYGGGGAFMNYREGARGIEMAPHHEFWIELPSLVVDGVAFAASAGSTVLRPLLSRLGRDKYQTLPEDENW